MKTNFNYTRFGKVRNDLYHFAIVVVKDQQSLSSAKVASVGGSRETS